MDSEQRQRLRRGLSSLQHRRSHGLGLLPWWRQWATRPQGTPFLPVGDLDQAAQAAAGTDQGPAYLVCVHALAMATWPGSRMPFAEGRTGGLGGAMARAITDRKWDLNLAEAHMRRIITVHSQPEPVLEALTQTVRALWNQGVTVDLAGTTDGAYRLLASGEAGAHRGRLWSTKQFLHPVYTRA